MTHRVGASAGARAPGSQTSGSQMPISQMSDFQMSGPNVSEAIRCAPHVKRAHRAVFARFVLVLRAALEKSAVSAGARA